MRSFSRTTLYLSGSVTVGSGGVAGAAGVPAAASARRNRRAALSVVIAAILCTAGAAPSLLRVGLLGLVFLFRAAFGFVFQEEGLQRRLVRVREARLHVQWVDVEPLRHRARLDLFPGGLEVGVALVVVDVGPLGE